MPSKSPFPRVQVVLNHQHIHQLALNVTAYGQDHL